MKILFLLNGIFYFGIFLFLFVKFIKHYDKSTVKVARLFSFIGLVYFLISLISVLWFFDLLHYLENDFLFLYSGVLITQSLILFSVVYLFSKNKKLFYFLSFYLMVLISLLFVIGNFLSFSLIASALFTLLIFLEFTFLDDKYKRVGYFGILYASISIILNLLLFLNPHNVYTFSLISGFFFFLFSFFFFKDLHNINLENTPRYKKEKSYFFILLAHLIFIITLTNFVFIGTIGIHEFGHYGSSKFYDCDYQKIVYDGNFFHTEILCRSLEGNVFVILGGVLLPFVLALLLFFIGGKFMKEIAILISGFNFIAISRDLADLGVSENFVFLSIFCGVLLLIYGLYSLAKSKTEESIYFGGNNVVSKLSSTKVVNGGSKI